MGGYSGIEVFGEKSLLLLDESLEGGGRGMRVGRWFSKNTTYKKDN